MSFRAWSGGRPEVLVAICEMKHCQVGNGQLSLLYNAPLIAPLIGKQWGINFADRLLHNGANISFLSSSSYFPPRNVSTQSDASVFVKYCISVPAVCIYLPFSFRRGQPQALRSGKCVRGGSVVPEAILGYSSYQIPADVPLWPSQEHGPWGRNYFPGSFGLSKESEILMVIRMRNSMNPNC